jgi:hypothetical protein
MDDGGTMDIPEPEPVDLSDARGWELAISLMRATEESLWPLLELFLVLILTMDISQPMLFRFLRLGVLAYLTFQCSLDVWQIRLSRIQIFVNYPFQVALLRWLQNVSRDLDRKHLRLTDLCRTMKF